MSAELSNTNPGQLLMLSVLKEDVNTAAVSESAVISLFLTVFAKNADDLCRI